MNTLQRTYTDVKNQCSNSRARDPAVYRPSRHAPSRHAPSRPALFPPTAQPNSSSFIMPITPSPPPMAHPQVQFYPPNALRHSRNGLKRKIKESIRATDIWTWAHTEGIEMVYIWSVQYLISIHDTHRREKRWSAYLEVRDTEPCHHQVLQWVADACGE